MGRRLRITSRLVGVYGLVALGTVAVLVWMSSAAPELATDEAWGHAMIVAAFAIVLLARTRAATKGSAKALRAVRIIAMVLLVVNLVEALLPGVFPAWMRIEMLAIAAWMALILLCVRNAQHR